MGWMMGWGGNVPGWNGAAPSGSAWGLLNSLVSVVLLVVVVVGVILAARYLLRSQTRPSENWPSVPPQPGLRNLGSSALRVLEDRYARGDIDSEEFRRRKQDLTA